MVKLRRTAKKRRKHSKYASYNALVCCFLHILLVVMLCSNAYSSSKENVADLARKRVKELIRNQSTEATGDDIKNEVKLNSIRLESELPLYSDLASNILKIKSSSKNKKEFLIKKNKIKAKPSSILPIIKPKLISFEKLIKNANNKTAKPILIKEKLIKISTSPVLTEAKKATITNGSNNKDKVIKDGRVKLSPETIATLNLLPDDLTGGKYKTSNQKTKVAIKRLSTNNVSSPDEWKVHETMGVSIKVRQHKMNVEKELEAAYGYIEANNLQQAILTYQGILKLNPNESFALFGLATAYHRLGDINKARLTYGRILQDTPNNLEALNNFLVLVGEESPQDALDIMERLIIKNPHFSPLQAQISLLYQKLGDNHSAIEAMRDASSIEPENMLYQYNLAVLYDQQGYKSEAMKTYRKLIEIRYEGKKIPTEVEDIQERLTFLASN